MQAQIIAANPASLPITWLCQHLKAVGINADILPTSAPSEINATFCFYEYNAAHFLDWQHQLQGFNGHLVILYDTAALLTEDLLHWQRYAIAEVEHQQQQLFNWINTFARSIYWCVFNDSDLKSLKRWGINHSHILPLPYPAALDEKISLQSKDDDALQIFVDVHDKRPASIKILINVMHEISAISPGRFLFEIPSNTPLSYQSWLRGALEAEQLIANWQFVSDDTAYADQLHVACVLSNADIACQSSVLTRFKANGVAVFFSQHDSAAHINQTLDDEMLLTTRIDEGYQSLGTEALFEGWGNRLLNHVFMMAERQAS